MSAFGVPQGVTPAFTVGSLPSEQYVYGQFPAFQPAPSQLPSKMEPSMPVKSGSGGLFVNHFLTIVGTLLVLLITITPMWHAYRLMWSSSFVFFIGRSTCFFIIVVCLSIVCFFSLAMLLLERFGRVEVKTDETIMYLFTSTITALGLFLLFMSVPLHSDARAVMDELTYSCGTGAQTQQLYAYYNVLLKMRLQSDCKSLPSIEQCPGYQEQLPYTGLLKDMEANYQCSGFCYKSNSTNAVKNIAALLQEFPDMETKNDFVGLLQGHVEQITVQARGVGDPEAGIVVRTKPARSSNGDKHGLPRGKLLSLLASNHSSNRSSRAVDEPWNQPSIGYGNTINNMEATGWMDIYPPTLFSNANYMVSCDGAIKRELQFGVMDISNLMYLEGAVLLVASILVGLLKIGVIFKKQKEEADFLQNEEAAPSQYHPYLQPAKAVVL